MHNVDSSLRVALRLAGGALIAPLALYTGCASSPTPQPENPGTAEQATKGQPAGPALQKLATLGWFDVATCDPAVAESKALNPNALLGETLMARARVMECFVDPGSRGKDKLTEATIEVSAGAAEPDVKVSGANLTPAGQACVKDAVSKRLAGLPHAAAGAAAVTTKVPFTHDNTLLPAVKLGVNDGSDVAAHTRLALPSACECFAAWKGAAPRSLKAAVEVLKAEGGGKESSPTLTFEPAGDAQADAVASCLAEKLHAKAWPAPSKSVKVPVVFRFINSDVAAALPDAAVDLQFSQLDQERGRLSAAVAVAAGARQAAAEAYNQLVTKFKAAQTARSKNMITVEQLTEGCGGLTSADDGWIAALDKLLDVEKRTHDYAAAQKAKDAAWSQAEAVSAVKQAEAAKDLASAKTTKDNDAKACPKVRK